MFNLTPLQRLLKTLPVLIAAAAALATFSPPARAIPSFARQSGQPCVSCHTVFPELTAFGRQFKLRGYTLGAGLEGKPFPYNLPLAASLVVSRTGIKDTRASDPQADFPRADQTIVQTAAIYYGGKIAGNSGAFVQYNYDGIERNWAIEMADIRYADSTTVKDKELLWGLTLNNAPTVQDVWNAQPMWGFPHLPDAGVMPPVTTLLDMGLASQVGGLGLYGFWDNSLYGELAFYRTASRGLLRPLSAGVTIETQVDGYAPYWHLMYNREMGTGNFAIGLHGMTAQLFPDPDNPSGPTDSFRDLSLDAQYQYLPGGNHIFTTDAVWIREKRDWDASFPLGMASNPSDNVNTFKLNAHYWYKRRVGGGIGYFSTWGDSDMLKYGMGGMTASAMGNATGSPDTRGWTIELNYLPLKTEQNLKLGVRYTAYQKFNGASTNYNGFGRDASDNNTLFGYVWLLF